MTGLYLRLCSFPIFLYGAEIDTELLDALGNPKDATKPVKCTVRRKGIPDETYDSFAGRLVADLVTSLNALDNVNSATERKKKRQHGQDDSESHKMKRVSNR